MIKVRFLFSVVVVGCCLSGISGNAVAASGQNAGDFLNIIPAPKTMSMGGGLTGEVSNSPFVAYNNPAGLLGVNRPWLALSVVSYLENSKYTFTSFATPTMYGNVGASIGYLDYGSMEGYTVDSNYNPSKKSSISSHDALAMLSYAFPVKATIPVYKEYGAIGVNLKFIQSTLADWTASGVAMDIGGVFNVPFVNNTTFGLAYKNFGSDLKYWKKSYPLPSSTNFGLNYKKAEWKNLSGTLDVDMPVQGPTAYSYGLSVSPLYFLTLRAGIRQTEDSLLSDYRTGFGLEFGDYSIDYSFTNSEYFNAVHHVGVSVAIGNIVNPLDASDHFLNKHFREACEFYYKQDYISARQKFEEILSLYPGHRPSQKYLEKIMEAMDNIEQNKIARINKYLKKAEAAVNTKDSITAKRYYNLILGVEPDQEDARMGLVRLEQLNEEIKREQAIHVNQKRIKRTWANAIDLYMKGDLVKSKNEFNEILSIDPKNEAAKKYIVEIDNQIAGAEKRLIDEWYLIATEFYKAGNYKEALKYFESVVLAAPHRLDAQDFQERCRQNLKEQEDKQKAEKLAKDQEMMKTEMNSIYGKALSSYDSGSYELSLKYFRKSEEIAAKYEFSEYLKNTKQYITMINSALAEKHYKIGFEYFRKNRFEAALSEYKKALQYNPDNSSAKMEMERINRDLAQQYYEQGMAYFSRNEMEKALEMIDRSLQFQPDKIESQRARERIRLGTSAGGH